MTNNSQSVIKTIRRLLPFKVRNIKDRYRLFSFHHVLPPLFQTLVFFLIISQLTLSNLSLGPENVEASTLPSGFTTDTLYIETNGTLYIDDFYTDDFTFDDGFVINLLETDGNSAQSLKGDTLSARMQIYQPYSCGEGSLYMTSSTDPLEDYHGGEFVNRQQADFTYVSPNAGWSDWISIKAGEYYGIIFIRGQDSGANGCGTLITLEVRHSQGTEITQPPQASFWADSYALTVPQCTYLRWNTSNAVGVTLDYDSVDLSGSQYVCPTSTTTYRLDAFSSDGQSTLEKVTINVDEEKQYPPEITFWVDSTNLKAGDCTYLHWTTSNAEAVELDGKPVDSSDTMNVCPKATTTYELFAIGVGEGDVVSQSVTIYVESYPEPAINFYADDGNLVQGECTNLNWSVSDASWVKLDRSPVNLSGSKQICPQQTASYILNVIGNDQKTTIETVTVFVDAAGDPLVELTADDESLMAGECTNLRWSATNAVNVTLDGTARANAGTEKVCPTTSSTYTIEAINAAGTVISDSVTITVHLKEVVCTDISQSILIVTHSRKLNLSTGNGATWDVVKSMLMELFQPIDGACAGAPVFLDLDFDIGGAFEDFSAADQAIETYISQHFSGTPAAVVIIGGPNVIPYGELFVTDDVLDPVITDDLYADFNHDANTIPDCTITRLPDGHSHNLLTNFIQRMIQEPQPPVGSSMIIPFFKAYERLSDPQPVIIRGVTGQVQAAQTCYLENYLQNLPGETHFLISPPWKLTETGSSDWMKSYIPANDLENQKALAGNSIQTELNSKDLVFVGLDQNSKAKWSFWSPDGNYYDVFGVEEALSLPVGAHVFAMVNYGADLTYWAVGETSQDSIPLAMLENSVHHFIGTTDQVFMANLSSKFSDLGNTFLSSLDVNLYDQDFAKTYFSMKCSRMGAAEAFIAAKKEISRDHLEDPIYRRSMHAYIFYGLPDRFSREDSECTIRPELTSCIPPSLEPGRLRNDTDHDGLPQEEETWIANTFVPYYIMDENEPTPLPSYIYQVTPFDVLPCNVVWNGSGEGVILTINALFQDDITYGELLPLGKLSFLHGWIMNELLNYSILWHHGDNEVVEVWLSRTQSACDLAFEHLYTSGSETTCYSLQRFVIHRHGHTVNINVRVPRFSTDPSKEYEFADAEFFTQSFGTHPILYVSKGKHASYFYEVNDCDGTTYQGTACGRLPFFPIDACLNKTAEICSNRTDSEIAGRAILPYLRTEWNVGEVDTQNQLVGSLSQSVFPMPYSFENAWGKEEFCGGYRQTGGGAEDVMLPQSTTESIKMSLSSQKILFWKIPEIPVCGGDNFSKWCGAGINSSYCGRSLDDGNTTNDGVLHRE